MTMQPSTADIQARKARLYGRAPVARIRSVSPVLLAWRAPTVAELSLPLPALASLVAAVNGMTLKDIRARTNMRPVVRARREYAYLAASVSDRSYGAIGQVIWRTSWNVRNLIGNYCLDRGVLPPLHAAAPGKTDRVDIVAEVIRRRERARGYWHEKRKKR